MTKAELITALKDVPDNAKMHYFRPLATMLPLVIKVYPVIKPGGSVFVLFGAAKVTQGK